MVTSSIGVFGAIFLGTHDKYGKNSVIIGAIQILKFFGIGIVVSTAWIHLLADAYSNFLNPCLVGDTWINYGANFPGWIAIGSAVTVQVLEYFAMSRQYRLIDQRQNSLPQNGDYQAEESADAKLTLQSPQATADQDITLKQAVGHSCLDEQDTPQLVILHAMAMLTRMGSHTFFFISKLHVILVPLCWNVVSSSTLLLSD